MVRVQAHGNSEGNTNFGGGDGRVEVELGEDCEETAASAVGCGVNYAAMPV